MSLTDRNCSILLTVVYKESLGIKQVFFQTDVWSSEHAITVCLALSESVKDYVQYMGQCKYSNRST